MKNTDWTALSLNDLGANICIIGPSNSGKSTLAKALSEATGLKHHHLDQIAHIPNTHWQRRFDEDFIKDHDDIIAQDRWIIEGNYSIAMKQRFDRASCVIWLDPSMLGFMIRYTRRSLKKDKDRVGGLSGAKSEFSLKLMKYTFLNYPKNRKKYEIILEDYTNLPVITINSMTDLNRAYKHWQLHR